MTNSTETYWDVDGVSLQTFAFNITTLGGDRLAPPPVRGEDIRVPYMPGTVFVERVPDQRIITLGMWVIGANEDGSIPTDEKSRRTFDRNWRMLRRLLWTPRRQFTLTKRFWLLDADLVAGGVDTSAMTKDGDWTLFEASAKGTYAGGLTPTMNGAARAVFTVDILLSDPFFYSDVIEVEFSTQVGGSNPGPEQTIQVLGDDRTMWIEADFEGPLTSPRIVNESVPQELWMRYATEIPDDEMATVRVHDFTATHYPSGDPYKSAGFVQHAGDKFWLYLEPGETDLTLDAQAGTGTALLRYRPAWM